MREFFLGETLPPPFLFFALSVIVSLSPSALKPNLSFLSPPKMKNKSKKQTDKISK